MWWSPHYKFSQQMRLDLANRQPSGADAKSVREGDNEKVRLVRVCGEMSLHVLAYNLKRVMRILGIGEMLAAIRAWGARALLRAQFQPVSAVQSVNAAQRSSLHSCSFASAPVA